MPAFAIAPEWRGDTAFIIAGGTSVASQGIERLRGRRVLVVNSSYEAAPWAPVLYFADRRWYFEHYTRPAFKAFAGLKISCNGQPQVRSNPEISWLRRVVPNFDPTHGPLGPGLAEDPAAVVSNRTSLQGAINIAAHYGVARIVLLGADMCRSVDGRTHHHSAHRWNNKPGTETWDVQMVQLALVVEPLKSRGIDVVNCSPISRLPWWPIMPLSDYLLVESKARAA